MFFLLYPLAVLLPLLDQWRLTEPRVLWSVVFLTLLLFHDRRRPVIVAALTLDLLEPNHWPVWTIVFCMVIGLTWFVEVNNLAKGYDEAWLAIKGALGLTGFVVVRWLVSPGETLSWRWLIQDFGLALLASAVVAIIIWLITRRRRVAYVVE